MPAFDVVPAIGPHAAAWRVLRTELWPHVDPDGAELDAWLAGRHGRYVGFVALGPGDAPLGFAEASLRSDYVEGCETSPVLFLEGLYVRAAQRGHGVARALCEAVAAWGRAQGCREFASDALLDNTASHAMHRALGFEETARVVYFRRALESA